MKSNYNYKEFDAEGLQTLEVVARADKFNCWMYETIKPYCNGKILEVGSGIGNISIFFLEHGSRITISDIRQNYREELKSKFSSYNNLEGVIDLDIVAENFESKYEHLIGKYDTVFSLNVLEHIKDDLLAIKNYRSLLKKNGTLIILVPAQKFLYNSLDKELFHFKRYKKNELIELYQKQNIQLIHSQYFNFIGMFGWFYTGNILKKKLIVSGHMKWFNRFVGLFKLIDKIVLNKTGLSVIAVGEKTD
jgi:SAM-dependent methyltransferase